MSSPEISNKHFSNDFRCKELPFFLASVKADTTWPRVMAYCDSDIPLTYEEFDKVSKRDPNSRSITVNFVVINAISPGFTKVPYSNDGSKTIVDEKAKPLSEEHDCPEIGASMKKIKCYPWTIVDGAPKEKDDRKEDEHLTWDIVPGMFLRFTIFKDSLKGSPDASKVKKGMIKDTEEGKVRIPAFSVVELELSIKGWDKWMAGDIKILPNGKERVIDAKMECAVTKRYGVAMNGIKTLNGTLYSVKDMLPRVLVDSPMEGQVIQKNFVKVYDKIANVIQATKSPFIVEDIARDSFFDYDAENGLIKVSQWTMGSDECIDIALDDALRFTNCTKIEDACSLLQFACDCKCLTIVVTEDPYRQSKKDPNPIYSNLYGAPIINTARLLEAIGEGSDEKPIVFTDYPKAPERFYEFQSSIKNTDMEGDDFSHKILISKQPLDTAPPPVPNTYHPLPSPDMCLVGIGLPMQKKAYFVKFVNPKKDDRVIWQGYFHLEKPGKMFGSNNGSLFDAGRLQRKRWEPANNDFDPFAVGGAASESPPQEEKKKAPPSAKKPKM